MLLKLDCHMIIWHYGQKMRENYDKRGKREVLLYRGYKMRYHFIWFPVITASLCFLRVRAMYHDSNFLGMHFKVLLLLFDINENKYSKWCHDFYSAN